MGKLVKFKHGTLLFKQIVAVTKDVMTEVNLRFDQLGVSIVGVDPEKTAVVEMRLDASLLQDYEVSETVTIGIFSGLVHKLLRNAPKDSTIEMTVFRDAPTVLELLVTGQGFKTHSKLKSLDIPVQNIIIPRVDYHGRFYIPSVFLYRLSRELNHVGTDIRISVSGENVIFESTGDTTSDAITVGPGLIVWDLQGAEFGETYLGRYIEKLSKTQIDKSLLVEYKPGHPIRFTYKFDEGFIRFLIAPIIPSE